MNVWGIYFFVSFVVIMVLLFMSSVFVTTEKTSMSVEMYECGIEPIYDNKIPFFIHFFLIGVLFLLFDVELIVCIPMVWMGVYEKMWGVVWFVFFFILFIGLIIEFMMGTISWKE